MIRRTRWYCPLAVALVCLGSTAAQQPVTNADVQPISFMGKLGQVDYKARTVVLGDPDRSPASPATPGAPAAVKRFRLAEKVAISVDGKKAELKDLRPGLLARVHVRMDASRGDNIRIEGGPRTPRDPETGNPISIAERIEAFTRAPGSGASDRDR
jgi:hypothetical protein